MNKPIHNKPTNFSRTRLIRTINNMLKREGELSEEFEKLKDREEEDPITIEIRRTLLYKKDGIETARKLLMEEFRVIPEELEGGEYGEGES